MNKYVKEFFHRGLIFSGFGPIVLGIVYLILSKCINDFSLTAFDVLLGIISTYLIAFVEAGASIFPQIEKLSKIKALFWQMSMIYLVYTMAYLINGWLPFSYKVLLVYTICFILVFLLIWLLVYLLTKNDVNKLNEELGRGN